jgi:hypothetical protein
MTLVVARRVEGRIHMVGDTKFTSEFSGARDGQRYFIGGLKIVILHPGAVIAFANNTAVAQQVIERIHSSGIDLFDMAAVINYLLAQHRRSLQMEGDAMVEFIAAFALDLNSELVLIKDGNASHVDAGYIGDAVAYNSFLQYQHRFSTTNAGQPPLVGAIHALDAVIRDSDLELQTVDGFTIGLRESADQGFCYVSRVSVEGWATPVRPGPMAPVTFGGAPRGANEWSIGSSPGNAFGVLTAYCHTGSFGVIYRPTLNFEPRIIRDCSSTDLIAESMQEVRQIAALLGPPYSDMFHQ